MITFSAEVNSINTEVEYRDNEFKSAGYFDAEKFPTLSFKSTSFKKLGEKTYQLMGNITTHGITKPIIVNAITNCKAVTAIKNPTAGFTITEKINRLDFGLGGALLSSGVSNEIELRGNIKFTIGN
ncbi:hypothetical protein A0256_00610 [Mucilaginibacter sp. PAMC 26640]|nr:hypothetical protein A0256_00610 [Mucilaginibacter sp. PAMC 26640]